MKCVAQVIVAQALIYMLMKVSKCKWIFLKQLSSLLKTYRWLSNIIILDKEYNTNKTLDSYL